MPTLDERAAAPVLLGLHDATYRDALPRMEADAGDMLDRACDDDALFSFIRGRVTDYARFVAMTEAAYLAAALKVCESPIEKRMLAALRFMSAPVYCGGDEQRPMIASNHEFSDEVFGQWFPKEGCAIFPQAKIGAYRVDFLIANRFFHGSTVHLTVVECDGHDFHEKTKQQAARDKKRDRDLAAIGCYTLRFTGSEIYRDATACANQVGKYLSDLEYRHRVAAGME